MRQCARAKRSTVVTLLIIYMALLKCSHTSMPQSDYSTQSHLKYIFQLWKIWKKRCHGYFTIRRTSKVWYVVWSDMTVEQVLMRALKTTGGFIKGRQISNSTCGQWVQTLPLCIPMCDTDRKHLNGCLRSHNPFEYTEYNAN